VWVFALSYGYARKSSLQRREQREVAAEDELFRRRETGSTRAATVRTGLMTPATRTRRSHRHDTLG